MQANHNNEVVEAAETNNLLFLESHSAAVFCIHPLVGLNSFNTSAGLSMTIPALSTRSRGMRHASSGLRADNLSIRASELEELLAHE